MGDGVKDEAALQAIVGRLFKCRCETAYTARGRHAPDNLCYWRGEADEIAEEAHALGRASGWQAAVQALAIHKPYGTYNNCRLCGSTWWDGKREEHRFDCVTRTGSPLVTDDQRASVSGERDGTLATLIEWAKVRLYRYQHGGTVEAHLSAADREHLRALANLPTDRNAGRDAAAPDVFQLTREQVVTLSGILTSRRDDFLRNGLPLFSAEPGLLDDMRDWLRCHPAVEAALKGGA